MALEKKYWKSLQALDNPNLNEEVSKKEFAQDIPVEEFLADKDSLDNSQTTRRDFLKYLGFSTAAASLAACTPGVKHVIPYVTKPDDITPGVATYYATSIYTGFDFASVLVRNRDGRPVRLEPNRDGGHFGETNARIQGAILSMYDMDRAKGPSKKGKSTKWSALTDGVKAALTKGERSVLLTSSVFSPSEKALIKELTAKYSNLEHLTYDAISSSALIDATEAVYGKAETPYYDLSKTDLIVSFGADFLNDWQGNNLEKDYGVRRLPSRNNTMLRHIQIEPNMSLTGANADLRIPTSNLETEKAIAEVYAELSGTATGVKSAISSKLVKVIRELKAAGSKAVVVSDSDSKEVQQLVHLINNALQSSAVKLVGHQVRQGDSAKVKAMFADAAKGAVKVLIMSGVNPAYTLPGAAKAIKKVPVSVSMSMKTDETAKLATYVASKPHDLEAWGDYEPIKGEFFLSQPTIQPLFNTKSSIQFYLDLLEKKVSDYDFIRANWDKNILGGFGWNKALHDGFYKKSIQVEMPTVKNIDASTLVSSLRKKRKGIELNLYTKAGIGDGADASNNPWLQELPDPVTRNSWDNYLTISKTQAEELGLENWNVSNGALNGHLVNITAGKVKMTNVPVYIQPGQAYGTIGLSFGYGRTAAGRTADGLGHNAYEFYGDFNKAIENVKIEKVEGEHEFASVQLQHTMMGRDIVRETTLADFINKPKEDWNPDVTLATHKGVMPVSKVDLWSNYDNKTGHFFNMSIDLTTCTGCAACVVSCHLENNVPVVGKEEIRMSRDMHWLRIDRYFSSDMTNEKAEAEGLDKGLMNNIDKFHAMEEPSETPDVVFQPVMCQHCNHAPCETVCPVAATSHSTQGQNHMAYNRCVGTRYCLNNCPYKVRRFNWFKYFGNDQFDFHMNNDLGRMVLNPDVVVRSRGVMEKCSLCIQSTQATILKAKREGRAVKEGEFQTACSSVCSTGAIQFGDLNMANSDIKKLHDDERKYYLLEQVGTKPNVFYQVKVRNRKA